MNIPDGLLWVAVSFHGWVGVIVGVIVSVLGEREKVSSSTFFVAQEYHPFHCSRILVLDCVICTILSGTFLTLLD